jgi:hypothetical protein
MTRGSCPNRYVTRPRTIEAMQHTVATCRALHAWLELEHPDHDRSCGEEIVTSFGIIYPGDWAVLDFGRFRVVREATFADVYMAVKP